MFKSVLFGNIGAGVYIIITLMLLGGGFALISPSTVTATPSNTTSTTTTTTTSAPTQLTTPPSAAAQQIINNTQAECEQAQFFPRECVILVYESPTTVVLNGKAVIFGGTESPRNYPNPFIWTAVDGFKAQGYTITGIGIGQVGNKTNPNVIDVIMSK
jgi:hypothetical protein